MFAYSTTGLDPSELPAPLAKAVITAAFSSLFRQEVTMLLDSGADMTCVPTHIIAPFRKNLDYSEVQTQSFDGRGWIWKKTYLLCLDFVESDFTNLEVLETEDRIGLIGRDVLNQLKLILDGPKLSWSIE